MTPKTYWRIIVRTAPFEWVADGDTMQLVSCPEVRIERQLGGQEYEAPWMLPHDGREPFMFSYAFWYRAQFVGAFPVIQVDPGLIVPVPHRAETGYAITSLQYHLARLVNPQSGKLDDYLQRAGIAIVPAFGVEASRLWGRFDQRLASLTTWLVRFTARFVSPLRSRTSPFERR